MQTKHCPRCKETKTFSCFGKNKNRKHGLQGFCKLCMSEIIAEYKKANREKLRRQGREYYADKIDEYRIRKKRWRETYPEKHCAGEARRRAQKLFATPPWLTAEQHDEILLYYEEAMALRIYTGQEYHVDHIVPLQGKNVSGLHVPWNLRVILAKDNLIKGNKYADS